MMLRILPWVFFILFTANSFCQTSLKFTCYTVDDGLSHNLIDDLIMDKYGYMWLATPNGLSRFNGLEFKNINSENDNSYGLQGRRINCLQLDNEDQLWVGNESGFQKYDYQVEKFTKVVLIPADHGSTVDVFAIAFNTDNSAWVGTSQGLFWINLNTYEQKLYLPDSNSNSLLDQSILSLHIDQKGKVWIGSDSGLSIYSPKEDSFENYTFDNDDPDRRIVGDFIRDIVEDKDGNIWIAAAGGHPGISKFDPKTDIFTHYTNIKGDEKSILDNGIFSIEFDDTGNLWAGADGGLELLNLKENTFTHIHHDPLQPRSLSLDIVMELYKDKNGRIWLGTFGGLNLWDKYEKQFNLISTGFDLKKKLIHGYVKALSSSTSGGYWVGMDGGGFSYYDPLLNEFKHYLNDKNDAPRSNKVLALLEEGSKGLWIGYWDEGLDFYDFQNKIYTNYKPIANDPTSISDLNIMQIFQDAKGRIWIATWNGLNLLKRDNGKITFKSYFHDKRNTNSLIHSRVNCVFYDIDSDMLLIGTEKGLSMLDLETENFTNFVHDSTDQNSLSYNVINDIFKSRNGKIWIGTSSGVNTFNVQSSTFEKIVTEPVATNIDVQSFEEDDQGNIWLSTKDGLYKLIENSDDPLLYHYTKLDGLHGNDFSNGTSIKLNSNMMVFGGMNGITYFNPNDIKENEVLPDIYIERIDLYDESSTDAEFISIESQNLLEKEEVKIRPNISMFKIQFIGLNYTNPSKTRYKYKLEGFQEIWHDIGNERSVSFTNLDAGTYTFKVIACNNDGIWNLDAANLSIILIPPWWKTNTARALFIVCLLFGFLTIIQLRTRNLRKSKQKLTSEVEKRTSEIKRKNQELDNTNFILDEKIKEIEAQNEEISAQLDDIMTKSEEIARKNKQLEVANKEREAANEQLNRLNASLEEIVEERTTNLKSTFSKLQKTSEELNTFLYRSSHDLKGPMTTLIGLAMLAKKEFQDEDIIKYFDLVEGTSEVMLRNLRKLQQVHLIFNRKLEPVPIDFELLKNKLLIFLSAIDKSGEITKKIELKNFTQQSLVCDPEILKIILENISENSVFYKSSENAYIHIQIIVEESGLSLEIEDNGLGISDTEVGQVFDMFYRGRENSKGAGLGLYVVKSAVEKMQGDISFESQNGVTKFVVKVACRKE